MRKTMRMHHKATRGAMLAWLVLGVAFAGGTHGSRTGDDWVDAMLSDIDRYGARYPDAFADELARYHDAPRALVADLLDGGRWTPGDVYFACVLGQFAGQPCRSVATTRDADRARDWDAIARGYGVAPESEAFARIKRAIVLSYLRWARPIEVDASLHDEFPKLPVATPTARATNDKAGERAPSKKDR